MSENVIYANIDTKLPIPTERVLEAAQETGMDEVVIVGWDKDGEFYFASSGSLRGDILVLLEKAKKQLIEEI